MDLDSLHKITQNFVTELENASLGKESSLSFIKNTIPSNSLVADREIFQVMEIGGTNYKSALVKKSKEDFQLSNIIIDSLPILSSKEILFSYINSHLNKDASVVALNFGFPQRPVFSNGKVDGILIRHVKDHRLSGLIGEKVGESLEKFVMEKFGRKIQISVANDTICLLLSGLIKKSFDSIAAGIVGTGINAAIFQDEKTLVNLEAGNFDKFHLSMETKEIDANSKNPGEQLFEKEISGGYLYKKFNRLVQKENISYPPLKNGDQLSVLALENKDRLGEMARKLLFESAQLASCMIAGIMEFQKKDRTFIMQGSVFWKGYQYRETVEKTVQNLTLYKAEFIKIENAGILGAAKLVG